jgi:hypothetical protein
MTSMSDSLFEGEIERYTFVMEIMRCSAGRMHGLGAREIRATAKVSSRVRVQGRATRIVRRLAAGGTRREPEVRSRASSGLAECV